MLLLSLHVMLVCGRAGFCLPPSINDRILAPTFASDSFFFALSVFVHLGPNCAGSFLTIFGDSRSAPLLELLLFHMRSSVAIPPLFQAASTTASRAPSRRIPRFHCHAPFYRPESISVSGFFGWFPCLNGPRGLLQRCAFANPFFPSPRAHVWKFPVCVLSNIPVHDPCFLTPFREESLCVSPCFLYGLGIPPSVCLCALAWRDTVFHLFSQFCCFFRPPLPLTVATAFISSRALRRMFLCFSLGYGSSRSGRSRPLLTPPL